VESADIRPDGPFRSVTLRLPLASASIALQGAAKHLIRLGRWPRRLLLLAIDRVAREEAGHEGARQDAHDGARGCPYLEGGLDASSERLVRGVFVARWLQAHPRVPPSGPGGAVIDGGPCRSKPG